MAVYAKTEYCFSRYFLYEIKVKNDSDMLKKIVFVFLKLCAKV